MAASSSAKKSNFDNLLASLTPVVPSKPIPKKYMIALKRMWKPNGQPASEYFKLGDLWDFYEKWSTYGAETKVQLSNGVEVVQFFIPHLSAIQISTNKSPANIKIMDTMEDSDDFEVDNEFRSDKIRGDKLLMSTSKKSSKDNGGTGASSGDSKIEHEDSFPRRGCQGNLYCKFHESCSPYWRIPLVDKIDELVEEYPGLLTLKSTDLSPASWMAISWYPIYHIPAKEPVEDLSASFLTFHTLSSFFQDNDVNVPDEDNRNPQSEDFSKRKRHSMSLSPFGLATYKFKGDVWLNHGELDRIKLSDLQQAADSWLKQLNFEHHDFKFFTKSG